MRPPTGYCNLEYSTFDLLHSKVSRHYPEAWLWIEARAWKVIPRAVDAPDRWRVGMPDRLARQLQNPAFVASDGGPATSAVAGPPCACSGVRYADETLEKGKTEIACQPLDAVLQARNMSPAEPSTQAPPGLTEAPAACTSGARVVRIDLSDAQVAHVVRSTSAGSGLAAALARLADLSTLRHSVAPLLGNPQYSRSLLRGLLVLGSFPADGSERELTGVAAELEIPAGTTHRYIGTWLAVGLLDQDPASRRYKRARPGVNARAAR